MTESLPVRLNHDQLHAIETVASFQATESFPILLQNGDAPVHVHLHLDDALSQVASIPANNHFVDAETTQQVTVEVHENAPQVEGQLKIVTGHGAETDYVAISIVEPDDEESVEVDATLADPARREADADDETHLFDSVRTSLRENAPIAALGLLAVAVAASSATLSDSFAVLLGVLAVLGSVAAAGYLLVGGE